jgi:hypothetical protein
MIIFYTILFIFLVKNLVVAYVRTEALKMIMNDKSKSGKEQLEIYNSYPSYFEMLIDWKGWSLSSLYPGIVIKLGF